MLAILQITYKNDAVVKKKKKKNCHDYRQKEASKKTSTAGLIVAAVQTNSQFFRNLFCRREDFDKKRFFIENPFHYPIFAYFITKQFLQRVIFNKFH